MGTAFAVLFMVRSTQKTLNPSSGTTVGGMGLPDDLSSLSQNDDGKIVKSEAEVSLETLLAEIGKGNSAILDKTANIRRNCFRETWVDYWSNNNFESRLSKANEGSKDVCQCPETRLCSAFAFCLERSRSRRDPHRSRWFAQAQPKIDGFGLPDKPTDGQKQTAQVRWQNGTSPFSPTPNCSISQTTKYQQRPSLS